MSTVCLDTQIVYWGIIGKPSSPEQQPLVDHAQAFFRQLRAEKHHILVPTVVLGELLVPVPEEEHGLFLEQASTAWMLADYNVQAALWFARIRRSTLTQKHLRRLQQKTSATRKELVADLMIIATALAHSADTLYSHDAKLLRLAENWIEARDFLPPTPPS